jgi:hypothetical protein
MYLSVIILIYLSKREIQRPKFKLRYEMGSARLAERLTTQLLP